MTARRLVPVRWYFEGSPVRDGFTDGTTWNGFANVRVTPAVHAEVVKEIETDEAAGGDSGGALEDLRAMRPGPDGLYNYSNGFAAILDDEPNPRAKAVTCSSCKRLMEPMPPQWTGPPLCSSCSPASDSPPLSLADPRQPWNRKAPRRRSNPVAGDRWVFRRMVEARGAGFPGARAGVLVPGGELLAEVSASVMQTRHASALEASLSRRLGNQVGSYRTSAVENPTLVHHGAATHAHFHLTRRSGAALADLYLRDGEVARGIGQWLSDKLREPVMVLRNIPDRGGSTHVPMPRVTPGAGAPFTGTPAEQWRARAAAALDATHHVGDRGPMTMLARNNVSRWLDLGGRTPVAHIRHLERVAHGSRTPNPVGDTGTTDPLWGGTYTADGWLEMTRAQWNKVPKDYRDYASDWTEFGKRVGGGTPSVMTRDASGLVLVPVRITDAPRLGRRMPKDNPRPFAEPRIFYTDGDTKGPPGRTFGYLRTMRPGYYFDYDSADHGPFASYEAAAAAYQEYRRARARRGAKRNPRELSVPERHQLKIARDTLRMSDAFARIMGGMTKDEARDVIRRLTGREPRENPRLSAKAHGLGIELIRSLGFKQAAADVKAGRQTLRDTLKFLLGFERMRPSRQIILTAALEALDREEAGRGTFTAAELADVGRRAREAAERERSGQWAAERRADNPTYHVRATITTSGRRARARKGRSSEPAAAPAPLALVPPPPPADPGAQVSAPPSVGRKQFQQGEVVTVPYTGRGSYFGRKVHRTRERGTVQGYVWQGQNLLVHVAVRRGKGVEDHYFTEDQLRRRPGTVDRSGAAAALAARVEREARGDVERARSLLEEARGEFNAADERAHEIYPQHGEKPSKEYNNLRSKMRRLRERIAALEALFFQLGGREAPLPFEASGEAAAAFNPRTHRAWTSPHDLSVDPNKQAVEFTRDEVAAFRAEHPGSGLPDRAITLVFNRDGALYDSNVPLGQWERIPAWSEFVHHAKSMLTLPAPAATCACGCCEVPDARVWSAGNGYDGFHSLARCWVPDMRGMRGEGTLTLAGGKASNTKRTPTWINEVAGDLDDVASNPRHVAKRLKWHMTAGGTGAWEGAHGYTARTPFGEYHIAPVTTQWGRRAGYVVHFAGGGPGTTMQLPAAMQQPGLWRELGRERSPNKAKGLAQAHHAAVLEAMPKENPRTPMLEKAARTFHKWHEFPHHKIVKVKGPDRTIPPVLVKLGTVPEIIYTSDKYTGRPVTYSHKTSKPHPILATDPEGKHLHIIGGRVKVTADGLVH